MQRCFQAICMMAPYPILIYLQSECLHYEKLHYNLRGSTCQPFGKQSQEPKHVDSHICESYRKHHDLFARMQITRWFDDIGNPVFKKCIFTSFL